MPLIFNQQRKHYKTPKHLLALLFYPLFVVILPCNLPAHAHPQTEISSPAYDVKWAVGSKHYITWETTQLADPLVRLEYSIDNKAWRKITKWTINSGEFLWQVPKSHNSNSTCRVRIKGKYSKSIVTSEPFLIIPSQEILNYKWHKVTDNAGFVPRDGAGALVFGGDMFVLGGWNPARFRRKCSNGVLRSKDGKSWFQEKANTFITKHFNPDADWEGRHTAGYGVLHNKMWIVGGDPLQGHYQSDVWHSKEGKHWSQANKGQPVPWGPRALQYTVVFQDKLWVMGGQTLPQFAPAKDIFYRDIWNSSDGLNWTQVIAEEPFWSARGMIGGQAVFKNRIWILGGGTYNTTKNHQRKYYNDVWSSKDGIHWKLHTEHAPWEPRQYHDVAVFDGHLWVLEGYHNQNLNDVWYSSDGVNWYEVANSPWARRHAASVFVYDNALWLVAGNNFRSDVWRLSAPTPNKVVTKHKPIQAQ